MGIDTVADIVRVHGVDRADDTALILGERRMSWSELLERSTRVASGLAAAGVGSTDHIAFDEVGLPGFQFLQDRTPGTGGHTNLDFYDMIQAEDLMKNATIMASYAYHAAMAEERMPRKVRPR